MCRESGLGHTIPVCRTAGRLSVSCRKSVSHKRHLEPSVDREVPMVRFSQSPIVRHNYPTDVYICNVFAAARAVRRL